MMLKSAVSFAFLSGFLVFLQACSSGSSQTAGGGGRYCNLKQSSSFSLPSTARKASLKPEDSDLPAGHYVYDNSDLLYVYKPSKDESTWIILQSREESYKSTRSPVTVPYCARGLKLSTPSFSVSTEGVSEITIQKDGQYDFKVRNYTLGWNAEALMLEVNGKAATGDFTDPSKVYEGKAKQFDMYKVVKAKSDRRYEIVSQEEYPEQHLTLYLKIRLIREDLDKIKKPAAVGGTPAEAPEESAPAPSL
jgi:hypothetical protein